METIYLVGQISIDEPITYTWRREIADALKGRGFSVLNPCDNEFNKEIEDTGDGTKEKANKLFGNEATNLIVPKDLHCVQQSTGCVVDMNHYDLSRPILGSFFELAWYYTMPEKFVVGVFDGNIKEDVHCNHPFVKATVHTWVEDHTIAVDLIEKYFR